MSTFYDRVKVGVTGTPGTGTLTLGSAVSGFRSFAAANIPDQTTLSYVIEDGANWEVGRGVYTFSSGQLTRAPIVSSNGTSAINASSAAVVYLTANSQDLALFQAGGSGTPARPKLTSLYLTHNMAMTASAWTPIVWDTVDIDEVSAFNTATPSYITVPSGVNRVKITAYAETIGDLNGDNFYFRLDLNGTTIMAGEHTATNESGLQLVSRWLPVNTGDQFRLYVNDQNNAGHLAGSADYAFGAPCFVEFEWSNAVAVSTGSSAPALETGFSAPPLASAWVLNNPTKDGSNATQSFLADITSPVQSVRLYDPFPAYRQTNYLVSAIQASPGYHFDLKARIRRHTPLHVNTSCGLILRSNVDNRSFLYGPNFNVAGLGVDSWSNDQTYFRHANYTDNRNGPTMIDLGDWWLRVKFDGTNFTFYYSKDGIYWAVVQVTDNTLSGLFDSAFQPNQTGFGYNASNGLNDQAELDLLSWAQVAI